MYFPIKKTLALLIVVAGAIHGLFAQTILRVNINTPCTSGCNGSTWALAYPSLQTALTAISSGEIWVAAGTYKPAGVGGDPNARFELKSNLAVYGGFNGTENSHTTRDYATNLTILSGDLNGDDVGSTNNSENSTNVVTSFYQTGVTLDGFTVKGGNATTGDGGGFYGAVGDMTVEHCIFEYNYAKYGGALNWSYSGGTSSSTSSLTVRDCTFRNNQSLFGGGIAYRLFDGVTTTVIENCLFENNYGNKGGGIYGISGSVAYNTLNSTIRGCTFKNNSAAYGGAMTFTNTTLTNNVVNCKLISNTATYGGAIYNGEGQQIFRNCLIAKNNATYGGAVETPEATQFINCTFSGNTGTHGTCFRSATAATTFTNCILWHQTAPIDNVSAVVNYCDVQGGWATGTGNINLDPQFIDIATDNYNLQLTSLCRNVGSNVANNEVTDLSSNWRILDGTIDLGAYESNGGPSGTIGILVTDAAFAAAIRTTCPTCINGTNYLTTVASTYANLDVNNSSVNDLIGILGFSSLTTLNVSNNNLMSLPTNIPSSLTTLNVSNNSLTSLPTSLPSSLTTLNVSNNSLTSLPTSLPSSLTTLNVANNSLTSLPTSLPSSLTTLNVANNSLTSLPTSLPSSLTTLNVANNSLTSLPTSLPSSLTTLDMPNNSITCLPTLPNTLTTFTFDAADINCLPNSPTALMTTLPVCAVITTHPSVSAAVCNGGALNLTAKANSVSPMTLKWQRKGAADANYTDLAAATTYTSNTTATYNFSPTSADNNALYRAVFTPACSGVTTTATQLTVINFTAPATTTNNSSLSFDGTNDCVQIVNCSGTPFPFTTAITIEYWFKGSSMQSAVRFQPDADTYIVSGWSNKHIISTSNGTTGVAVGTGATDGNWHHVAMTWQKGVANGFIPYLDGVRGTRRTATNVNLPTMTSGFYLGSNNGTSEFMNGAIDEVRIWNVARTQAEIQANMCNLTLPQTGLVMYYKFNHGIADGSNTVSTIGNTVQSDAYIGILSNFNLSGTSSNFSSNIPSACPAAVLPVELLGFTGQYTEGGNFLTWTTANEVNNKGFQVERLMENGEWLILGFVKGRDAINAKPRDAINRVSTYDFTDTRDAMNRVSTSYYRLRQIDNDGKETLSKVVSVSHKISDKLKVYPNPVLHILTVERNAVPFTNDDFQILNVLGQIVISGKTAPQIDVSTLAEGTYFLKVGDEQVKFMKQ